MYRWSMEAKGVRSLELEFLTLVSHPSMSAGS